MKNASDDFPQQKKLENLLPNFAGSSPPISPKTSPTSLWTSLVLIFCALLHSFAQQTRVYPYPLVAGSPRPNPKMGAQNPEHPLFLGFSVLRGGPRPWSETMVSEGARPLGRGRSGDCDLHSFALFGGLAFTLFCAHTWKM